MRVEYFVPWNLMSDQKYLIPVGSNSIGSRSIGTHSIGSHTVGLHKGEACFEQVIKRSRFISKIRHVESVNAAKQWFADVKNEFPDARHVCWAYISGAPNSPQQSSSDDGEPSGTAGKPILNVLQHSEAGEIAAVVVRYFGGIKLGAGGLVRAYSSSAAEAMKATKLEYKIPQQQLHFELPFAEESTLRYHLEQFLGQIESINYQEQVSVVCVLPVDEVEQFIQKLPHSIQRISTDNDAEKLRKKEMSD